MQADTLSDVSYFGRLSDGQKTMALELAGIGVIQVDYAGDEVLLDGTAAEIFGLPCDEPVSRAMLHSRIHPDDWPVIEGEVERLLDPSCDDVLDVTHRTIDKDGATRWIHARKRLYRGGGADGQRPRFATAAIKDVTDEVRATERSALLMREMAHRTKNIVALASVLAEQTMRHSGCDAFLEAYLPRLANLSDHGEIVGIAEARSLSDCLGVVLQRLGVRMDAVDLDGPELMLERERAQAMMVIAHELATNAIKYGALSRLGGTVTASWRMAATGRWLFRWRESGGPAVTAAAKQGFGTRILTRYASMSLDGRTDMVFEPGGLRYHLDFAA